MNIGTMESKFRKRYVKQTPGDVLVVGSKIYPGRPDWREVHPHGFGIDMEAGDGVDQVKDLCDPMLWMTWPLNMTFGHVDCLSVMEHSQRPWLMAENLQTIMRPGSSIFLSVPWTWRFHGYPHDYWRFSHMTLPILFPRISWQDVRYSSATKFSKNPRGTRKEGGSLAKMQLMAWGFMV